MARPTPPRGDEGRLHTATGTHRLRVRVADDFAGRFQGLMLAPPLPADEALLLYRCASVHTAFMRGPIDLAYLDAAGVVTRCVPGLKPWRLSAAGLVSGARSRHTLELAEGGIARLDLRPGDRFEHRRLLPAGGGVR